MKVSRREFVSTLTCVAAANVCALPSFASAASGSSARQETRGTLLNLEANCVLPESLVGMQSALGNLHHSVLESEFVSGKLASSIASSRIHAHIVIVPAAGAVRPAIFSAVAELLDAGATVLWESGAAFLGSADFAPQQALTKNHFGISIGEPVVLWPRTQSRKAKSGAPTQIARTMRAIGHEQIPYVTYRWPLKAHVRDFSRVTPVSAANGHAIAHWGETPVAWSRNVAAGNLVFLGSPLGPALRAGDAEATALFQSIRTTASE